jgi:serine/threonine protein phosphatase PrpC
MIGRRNRKPGPSGDQDLNPPQQSSSVGPEIPAPLPERVRGRGLGPEESAVAEVVGPTVIPQITIGSPSPTVEPSAIATAYSSLPFRPDVVIDGWSTDTMTVRGVSLRGHLHRYNGAPRQDDFAVHQLPDGRVIVLVADGVSGAPQSHIGASTVIKQAAEWLHSNLGHDLSDTDWLALLKSASWALTERAQTLLGLDTPDPLRAEEELATTLVCAVVEPTGARTVRAHLVSAGDSAAWLLTAGEFAEVVTGKTVPTAGIASSAVVGLPRLPPEVIPNVVDIAENDVLLIATDGIGDPLGNGQGGVGNLLRDVLTKPSPPSLIEFAHAMDFSRETFDDDRTLVAVWPRKQPPQETATRRLKPSAVEGLR